MAFFLCIKAHILPYRRLKKPTFIYRNYTPSIFCFQFHLFIEKAIRFHHWKSYSFYSHHVTSPNYNYFPCNTCTKNLWVIFGLFFPHKYLPSIDFTDFLRSSSKSAVADKKHSYHILKSSWFALVCPVLPQFAGYVVADEIVKTITE